ncbi:MAG: RagB/SusD family nutrient uptake outer membrane protein, partial [Bacteroidales bacterium]|nr:RagB/SusD family nutrient uptake outer membrane protein [Bacteroidales bacterium]
MKKIFHIYILGLMLVFTSCDGFLEQFPHDAISDENVLETEKDAQVLLNGIYARFKSGSSYGRYLTNLPDIMTDAALASTGFTNQMGAMYAWNITPGGSEITGIWNNHYFGIANANILLGGIDQLEGNEDNLNRMKGEALIARALFHYNLVRLFGSAYNSETADEDPGVPYMLAHEIGEPKRHTVAEVYTNIINDLSDAIAIMSDSPKVDHLYFTSHFANGLLARVYMDMRDYDNAIIHASEVIEKSGCSLEEGSAFEDMWLLDTGREIIWKVAYSADDYGASIGYNYFNRNDIENGKPQPDYIPADWLLNLYNQSEDIRFSAYYIETETDWGWTGYLVNKYPTNPLFDQQGVNMP